MPFEKIDASRVERAVAEARLSGGSLVAVKTDAILGKTEEQNEISYGQEKRDVYTLTPIDIVAGEIKERLLKEDAEGLAKSLKNTKRGFCKDQKGNGTCGICGTPIGYGDGFVEVDLADYGSSSTDRLCATCMDSICEKVFS